MRKTALGLFKSSASTSALKETVVFTYCGWRGRNAVSELAAASGWVALQCPCRAKRVLSTKSAGFQLSNFRGHQAWHNFLFICKFKLNNRSPSEFHNVFVCFFLTASPLLFLRQRDNQRRKRLGLRPTVTGSFSSLIAISIPALPLPLDATDAGVLQAFC